MLYSYYKLKDQKNFFIQNKKFLLFEKNPNDFLSVPTQINNNKLFLSKSNFNKFVQWINFNSTNITEKVHYLFQIELKGIGFKTFKFNSYIAFDFGYSNIILLKNKSKIVKVKNYKQDLAILGSNKAAVMKIASLILSFYHKDNYHGKGIIPKNFILKKKKRKS